MAYKAKDIAAYIVNYSIEKGNCVSNLKLQKLLYYVQAYFSVKKGTPCFSDDIEHWRHGPVVREIYSEYKIYFNDNIRDFNDDFPEDMIEKEDKLLINDVVDSYKGYGPWEMVEKTHKEKPWQETKSDEIIEFKEIKKYFEKHEEDILG